MTENKAHSISLNFLVECVLCLVICVLCSNTSWSCRSYFFPIAKNNILIRWCKHFEWLRNCSFPIFHVAHNFTLDALQSQLLLSPWHVPTQQVFRLNYIIYVLSILLGCLLHIDLSSCVSTTKHSTSLVLWISPTLLFVWVIQLSDEIQLCTWSKCRIKTRNS